MPTCKKCGVVRATAEMRRSPTDGFLCRDKPACSARLAREVRDAVSTSEKTSA